MTFPKPAGETSEVDSAGCRGADPAAMAAARPGTASGLLDRDISRFLLDFSIAIHHVAMYPTGHPSLDTVLGTLARRTDRLLQDRPKLAVGVARDRLVIEGVVTAADHPLLRALAERLHRHQLSALCLYRGISAGELSALAMAIAEDPDRGGGALGRRAASQEDGWPHVGLFPLTVGGLELVEPGEGEGAAADRCAVLWVGLAQAALGRDASEDAPTCTEPAEVARAIDEHRHAEAYDQVIVGYLQQIAEEVRAARAPEAIELRRRVSTLVSAMHPDTLHRLLAMGGDAIRRRAFVHSATAGLTAGAVVELVKAAAEASDEALSGALVRLLTKLAGYADSGAPRVQPLADSALRVQVERLIAGWNLPDPNPTDYGEVLQRIAGGSSPGVTGREPAGVDDPNRVLQICLDLDIAGPALHRAIDALASSGGLERAIDTIGVAARADGRAAAAAWETLVSADTVRRLLGRVPPDLRALDALLPHLDADAIGPLFDLLLTSDDRHLRRAAFDRLRQTGRPGAVGAIARLADDRWYVHRNLLALLAEIDDLPPGVDPIPWLGHTDARVRREALRVALRLDAVRDRAVWAALGDPDDRVRLAAINAASARPTASAAPRLIGLARLESLDDTLRAAALDALVRVSRSAETRDLLLEIAAQDTRRRRWAPRDAPGRAAIAALAALAACWPRDPRVAPILRRAAASREPSIRLAATEART